MTIPNIYFKESFWLQATGYGRFFSSTYSNFSTNGGINGGPCLTMGISPDDFAVGFFTMANIYQGVSSGYAHQNISSEAASGSWSFVGLGDGASGTVGFGIKVYNDGSLDILGGSSGQTTGVPATILHHQATGSFPVGGTTFSLTFSYTLSTSSGTINVYNSSGTLICSGTGNTSMGFSSFNGYAIYGAAAGGGVGTFGDVIISDIPAANGTIVGLEVFPRPVLAASGTPQWTPVGHGANLANLLVNPPVPGTDFNTTSTANQIDEFTLTALPSNVLAAYSTGVKVIWNQIGAGSHTAELLLKSSTTTSNSGSITLQNSPYQSNFEWEQDPNTSAPWTVAAANSAIAGYESLT